MKRRPKEAPLELTQSARDVSVTERGGFRTCRRRWVLEVIDNLTPKSPQWALEFGTGIHAALEDYYNTLGALQDGHANADEDDPLSDAYAAFEHWYDEMVASQKKTLGPLFSSAVEDELWDLLLLGKDMLSNYTEYAADKQNEYDWHVLAVEGIGPDGKIVTPELFGEFGDPPYGLNAHPFLHQGRILCPIVNPRSGNCLPGRPYLSGRLDLIVRWKNRHDTLWVVDHKTIGSSPSDRGLDFDDQVTGYSYLMWRLTGVIPRGTVFNYLVKQVPKQPRIVQESAKNPGGLSTAKDQLCLARDYRQALLDRDLMLKNGSIVHDAHAECYEGLLAKGWDPYFKRFQPQRNEHEILSFEERLYEEYKDIRSVYHDRNKAYPNLSTWWCPTCSVAPICQAMEDGSDVESIINNRFMQAPDRKAER